MRIIKHTAYSVSRIAEAMLNTEIGAEVFIDGKVQQQGTASAGYPKFNIGGTEYRVKATEAYVYLGTGVGKIEKFGSLVKKHVEELERQLVDTPWKDYSKTFHTVKHNIFTNVKARDDSLPRAIVYGDGKDTVPGVRFTWRFTSISKFDYHLDSSTTNAVARYFASIFYDYDGICTLSDGAYTPEFSRDKLVGMQSVIEENIFLSYYYNPVAFEVNPKWRNNCMSTSSVVDAHRNVNAGRVFHRDWKDVHLKPTTIAQNDVRDDVCSVCHGKLYDDIYVLYAPQKHPDFKLGTPICPLCMHLGEKRYETKYFYIFRTRYPRTLEQVINTLNASDERKSVLRAAARGIRVETTDGASYWVLGDEYLVFSQIDEYIYSALSTVNKKKVLALDERNALSTWVLSDTLRA